MRHRADRLPTIRETLRVMWEMRGIFNPFSY